MKRLMLVVLTALASAALFAGEPVAGGIKFTSAVNVDGTDYPANTTIYAESYPTQFVVKPVVAAGSYLFYAKTDADHGSRMVYPDLSGAFTLMPPPTPDDVVTYACGVFANVRWVDASADPADTPDGSEEHPYRTLQEGADAIVAWNKSYAMLLVKKGVYDEGGVAPTTESAGSRLVIPTKTSIIVRAVDGPEETFIVGEPDTSVTTAGREGWGGKGYRCVTMGKGTCLQGFTLTGGYVGTQNESKTGQKAGAAVYYNSGQNPNPADAHIVDCIISNNHGNAATLYMVTATRCRITGNRNRAALLSGVTAINCAIDGNTLVESGSFTYCSGAFYGCTIAGNAAVNALIGLDSLCFNCIAMDAGKSTEAGGANNWAWNFAEYTKVDGSAFRVEDPKVSDATGGDLRLLTVSPCIDGIAAPTADYYLYATSDIDGKRLRVGADGEMTPGAYQAEFVEGYPGTIYVDPVNGSDANDGWHADRALKTLIAAMTNAYAQIPGSTVYVKPGVYDTGTMPSDASEVLNRVSVPAGVSLVSLGSAADTFLIGAAATDETAPVRCVHLHSNSSIKGFTLTGGHTDANENGGGVYAPSSSSGACVYDCVITNNVSAKRAGAASSCSLHRCYIADNSSSDGVGTALVGGALYNCIVDSQKRGGSRCYTTSTVRNCTFLPTKTADAQEAVNYASAHSADHCYNSIFLCQARWDAQEYTDCIIATNSADAVKRTYDPEVLGPTVKLLTMAECGVRADGTLRRNSPAVDAGDNALYDAAWGDVDIKGSPRIINGTIDIGACELDPSLLKGLKLLVK